MMDYDDVLANYPWLIQSEQNAIISFDADGWVCAVALAHCLNWNIVGYYDSERLVLKNGVSTNDCVFIDVEIFRAGKRSFGHHLILFDNSLRPADFNEKTESCFNPNLIRGFDKKSTYRRKYPLGTFHLIDKLLRVSNKGALDLTTYDALSVVWFIDGLMNVRYNYAANVVEWIDYLRMSDEHWFREMNERGESLVKSTAASFIAAVNDIQGYNQLKNLLNFSPGHLSSLVSLIAGKLGIPENLGNWCLSDYTTHSFNRNFVTLNSQSDFTNFWDQNPFSMSTYFQGKISYTLEHPNPLP